MFTDITRCPGHQHTVDEPTVMSSSSRRSNVPATATADSLRSQGSHLAKMDPYIRCPVCSRYFRAPVLLPCGHSLCRACVAPSLLPASDSAVATTIHSMLSPNETASKLPLKPFDALLHNDLSLESSSSTVSTTSHRGAIDFDQLSTASETDSGVVMASQGRLSAGQQLTIICPSVLGFTQVNHPNVASKQVIQSLSQGLNCPLCNRIVALMDDRGSTQLPRNRALERLLAKLTDEEAPTGTSQQNNPTTQSNPVSQCDDDANEVKGHLNSASGPPHWETTPAVVCCCEQGGFCHADVHQDRPSLKPEALQKTELPVCPEHSQETANLFCCACRVAICKDCVLKNAEYTNCLRSPNAYGRHANQEVQPVQTHAKHSKIELSQVLQGLSEKVRGVNQYIQHLRAISETVSASAKRAEDLTVTQFGRLIRAIETKKSELIASIREERDFKQHSLKEHIRKCTKKLVRTTGFIQFCIEMLKESDQISFIQVSQSLINRGLNAEKSFLQIIEKTPVISQCSTRWQHPQQTSTGHYRLHIPSPSRWHDERTSAPHAPFRFVSLLELEAIHKMVSGLTLQSEIEDQLTGRSILRTPFKSKEPCFHMDISKSSTESLQFANYNRSVTCRYMEDCVALASTGLSQGIHYWEFVIDRLDDGGQPAFGVSKLDCEKEAMLGHDNRSWSMYIDRSRSWFLHMGEHFERTDGGIEVGSVVGIRLDCERGTLSYYLDDEPHGPIAFTGLPPDVYYPAVSLNRAVQVTLRSGLVPPSESEESDEESTEKGKHTIAQAPSPTAKQCDTSL